MKVFNLKLLTSLFLIIQSAAIAGGSEKLSFLGAKSNALNGLYFAGIDGISNVFQNPAGLVFLSKNFVELTGFLRIEEQQFESSMRGLHKSFIDEDLNAGGGIFWSFSDEIKTALAFSSYYEYKVNWPYILLFEKGTSTTTIASDMNNQFLVDKYSLSAAYNFSPLSFGLSFNVLHNRYNVSFAQANDRWINNIGFPAYQFDYAQDGWGWNFNFGMTYQAQDDLRIGLTVEQGFEIALSGDASTRMYAITDSASNKVGLESKYNSPWKLGLGLLYDVSSDLQLNIDFRYNLFGGLPDKAEFILKDEVWNTRQNLNDTTTGYSSTSLPLYYDNSFDLGFGLAYRSADDLDIYFGYRFTKSPNSEKTFSLLNPAVDHHSFSAGFGYEDEFLRIEGSIIFYLGNKNEVKNSEFKVHNGKYDSHGATPALTFRYKL